MRYFSILFGIVCFLNINVVEAEEVDLNLVLAIDVSSSVDYTEFGLQMRGYAEAFRTPEVHQAITSGHYKRVAVTLFQWAGIEQQHRSIGWTVLRSPNDAMRFADRIDVLSRGFFSGGTSIADALSRAEAIMLSAPHQAIREVIDISGDGRVSIGDEPEIMRDLILERGITINGLPILTDEIDLDQYYQSSVIGGRGAFLEVASDYSDFSRAIAKKLAREIKGELYGF